MRDTLAGHYGAREHAARLEPLSQFVRSMLGSRTHDTVSWPAYRRLAEAYPVWSQLAEARAEDVESVIADVTHASDKARRLIEAMRMIVARRGDFDLRFLAFWPLDAAFEWLERLPGAGPKVAASTLNFSTLERRAFVADTHVLRVLQRYGIIGAKAGARRAHDMVTASAQRWSAGELGAFHVLMKLHGQTLCTHALPRCRECPLKSECQWSRHPKEEARASRKSAYAARPSPSAGVAPAIPSVSMRAASAAKRTGSSDTGGLASR